MRRSHGQPAKTCKLQASDGYSCMCIMAPGRPSQMTTNWGLKTTQIYSLPVLEARDPKSRSWLGRAPFEGSRGGSLLPLPASGGPRRPLGRGPVTPVSAQSLHSLSLLCLSSVCFF